ncbi:MAG: hypothetical protein RXS42_01960 [Nitrososphaeria archaeon]
MTGKRKAEYVTCAVCGQRVRSDKFERHSLMHWIMSSSERSFREFYSELRKGAEAEASPAES